MSVNEDYGPLTQLIGSWYGDSGLDIAPTPIDADQSNIDTAGNGEEQNPFYETLVFTPVGEVVNAESQSLMALHYRKQVSRKSTQLVFHDESGYWLYDRQTQAILQSFSIPRGVCVLARGHYRHPSEQTTNASSLLIEVSALREQQEIIESSFLKMHAQTLSFTHQIKLNENSLYYQHTTLLEIYQRRFHHLDENTLTRQQTTT